MLYIIAKNSGSCRELKKIKNIKKIRAKASKKSCDSNSDSSSVDLDADSSLASDSSWDIYRQPDGRKEMNKLYHVVTNNLKTTKYQLIEAINNKPTFDNNSFNLSSGTRNPLPVVIVSLQGGKKHRPMTIDGIKCLWDSGATNSMIKKKHTKYSEHKMRSNKVEYSMANGM